MIFRECKDGCFEEMRSLEQELTFDSAQKEFSDRNLPFGLVEMKTLGILSQDGIYTNLGLLLSEQCMHTIKAAVFEGTNQNVFKDRKEFTGSLFRQMREVYDYIDFHNQTRSTFDKLLRIDSRDYPEAAIREALLNSLVHREYSFRASTLISIYEDRIEFTSIGGLVSGVTLDDVMLGISVCRNAKLANVFYRLELIEAYGTGIRKIMDAYGEHGKKPQIITSDNAFKIILPNLNHQGSRDEKQQLRTEDSSERIVIELAKDQGVVTRKQVERLLGIGQTTSGRLLRKMTERGELIQEGKGKNTHYRFLQ